MNKVIEEDYSEKIINKLSQEHYLKYKAKLEENAAHALDPDQFGNLSSIMINPNEISNAVYGSNVLQSSKAAAIGSNVFNFAKELEMEERMHKMK